MTNDPKPRDEPRVWCRRLDKELPVHEHTECPYCFGEEKRIAAGEHRQFCDFVPGRDPLHFGFPPDSSRNLEA